MDREVFSHVPPRAVGRRCYTCGSGGRTKSDGTAERFVDTCAPIAVQHTGELGQGIENGHLAICETCVSQFAMLLGSPTLIDVAAVKTLLDIAERKIAERDEEIAAKDRLIAALRTRQGLTEHLPTVAEFDEADAVVAESDRLAALTEKPEPEEDAA